MAKTTIKVRLTFKEPLLGTTPKDPDVYARYIESKAPENDNGEDESATVPEEQGWTGFHEEDGKPFIYNYAIKGFFKDACSCLRRVSDTSSKKLTSHKKVIDGLCFIEPRRIPIKLSGEMLRIERPLRAQTAQGERIALARSDAAPIGSSIEFSIIILGGIPKKTIIEWLDYGSLRGLGQWRNSGVGAFTYEILSEDKSDEMFD